MDSGWRDRDFRHRAYAVDAFERDVEHDRDERVIVETYRIIPNLRIAVRRGGFYGPTIASRRAHNIVTNRGKLWDRMPLAWKGHDTVPEVSQAMSQAGQLERLSDMWALPVAQSCLGTGTAAAVLGDTDLAGTIVGFENSGGSDPTVAGNWYQVSGYVHDDAYFGNTHIFHRGYGLDKIVSTTSGNTVKLKAIKHFAANSEMAQPDNTDDINSNDITEAGLFGPMRIGGASSFLDGTAGGATATTIRSMVAARMGILTAANPPAASTLGFGTGAPWRVSAVATSGAFSGVAFPGQFFIHLREDRSDTAVGKADYRMTRDLLTWRNMDLTGAPWTDSDSKRLFMAAYMMQNIAPDQAISGDGGFGPLFARATFTAIQKTRLDSLTVYWEVQIKDVSE